MPISSWKLTSSTDQSEYPIQTPIWKSEQGNLLDITFDPTADTGFQTSQLPGLWKFLPYIPVFKADAITSFGEGNTPVVTEHINDHPIRLKLEYLFPTGSYKDRGATVLISKIKELGINHIVEDSSGNAGCAIAAYAAKAGISCEILVAASTSPAKIKQLDAYGAEVVKVDGNREAVAAAALKRAENEYYASHSWNPFFFQGTKTFAYEIAEQCADNFPKKIILPVGNGTLLIGAYVGFSELYAMKRIPFIPEFIAVQATNCSPLASNNGGFKPTVAEGIAIQSPIRENQILDIIRKTNGKVVTVSEEEILEAWKTAAAKGYYIEKTSATGWAAFSKLTDKESCLLVLTGHGLKNT